MSTVVKPRTTARQIICGNKISTDTRSMVVFDYLILIFVNVRIMAIIIVVVVSLGNVMKAFGLEIRQNLSAALDAKIGRFNIIFVHFVVTLNENGNGLSNTILKKPPGSNNGMSGITNDDIGIVICGGRAFTVPPRTTTRTS